MEQPTKKVTLINLTPRTVTVVSSDGKSALFTLMPSEDQAYCTTKFVPLKSFNGVEVGTYDYSDIKGLPPAKPGVVYVVTWAVLQALNGMRSDVVAPDTAPGSVVRGNLGFVDGVKRFRVL